MNSKISSLMRLILLLLSIVLTQPACAAAKTIFVRPPYAPGGVEVKYGKENGSSYKNAFPGPDALREAVSKKKIQLKPGDTIALVGGQFLYTWYDIRNSLNLEIDGFKGAEGKQIVITGKLAGYPNGVIYGLYLQSHQQSSRDAKSAWHDEKLWKSDAAGDNVKPGGETVAAKGWFYNEFYMSNPKLCKYGRLVDLDPDSNLWRYYHKAKTWREFVDSEGGSYFTVKEKFVSPFTGAQKNTSRIWIKPFRDIKNNKWAHRAVILGTSKALSSINFRNECKYVSVQDLAIYFAANPSGPVVDWKTPEFTTSHISFKRCRIWSNHFMAAMIFEPKNAQYLTIEDCDLAYARVGLIYFRAVNPNSRYVFIRRNRLHHSGGNPVPGDIDWPNLGEQTHDCHGIGHQSGTQDIYIEDNFFHLCGTPLETHSAKQVNNFYILRNFFYKCGRKYVANNGVGGRCIEISGIQGSQNHRTNHHVAYNMAYDCQGFLGANQASPLFIYNNIALNVGYGFWFFNQSKPLQVTLENNVVRGLNPDQPKAYGGENKAPHFVNYTCWAKGSYLKSRNNLFFDSRIKSGLTFCSPSGSYRNTAVKKFDLGLTIASGSEGKGDRFSDPKCKVSVPSGADRVSQVSLRLSPDSPLPGAGIPVEVESYPSSDIFHTEIRKDNVPIGAYLPAN